MEQWYTLYTKPNAEYQVAATLRGRGVQTYLPEVDSRKGSQGRGRAPFFPCYLFVSLDFKAAGLSGVQWTPGLRRIVAFGDQPVPVADEVINLIMCKLGEIEADGGWPAHSFKPGDTVRITDGPLQGLLAIFEGPTTPAQRVRVLLTILGHASRAQVCVTDLEKVSPGLEVPPPRSPRRTRGQGRRIEKQSFSLSKRSLL
jgi:transcriptional antiterminator RfaH